MNTGWAKMVVMLALLCGTGTAGATFVEVDDFEDGFSDLTDVDDQNGWDKIGNGQNADPLVVDPADASNTVLNYEGGTNDTRKENLFKSATIADGDTGTLFFRLRLLENTDLGIGLTHNDPPAFSSTLELASYLRVNGTTLQAYDGGGFKTLDSLSIDQWYSIWMVIDNNSDEFSVYIQGGTFVSQTLLDNGGDSAFAYRFGSGNNDLLNFVIGHNANGREDETLFDDIYLDSTARNLSDPTAATDPVAAIPEPATAGLVVLALGGLMVRRHG